MNLIIPRNFNIRAHPVLCNGFSAIYLESLVYTMRRLWGLLYCAQLCHQPLFYVDYYSVLWIIQGRNHGWERFHLVAVKIHLNFQQEFEHDQMTCTVCMSSAYNLWVSQPYLQLTTVKCCCLDILAIWSNIPGSRISSLILSDGSLCEDLVKFGNALSFIRDALPADVRYLFEQDLQHLQNPIDIAQNIVTSITSETR